MGFFSRSKKPQQPQPGGPPGPSNAAGFLPSLGPHSLGLGSPPPPPLPPHPSANYPQASSWQNTAPPPPPPPIIVNQHYHFGPAPVLPPRQPAGPYACAASAAASKLKLGPMVNLANEVLDDSLSRCQGYGSQVLGQSNAVVDDISASLSDVLTMIDCDRLRGNEQALFVYQTPSPLQQPMLQHAPPLPGPEMTMMTTFDRSLGFGNSSKKDKKDRQREHPSPKGNQTCSAVSSSNYFSKVDLYANSRLPLNLPPLKLYMPTYPLLCLAAQYSESVYSQPRGPHERAAHVSSSWRTGTKAMVIKSLAQDDMNTIVFAIRGTTSFADWAVNLNMAPTSPRGFLDDEGNLCHAGFLSVARKSVAPVAARLRQLLQEDPGRAACSLLITGHSAGGAVAALLYSHMLSTSAATESELSVLTGCFRRVHCVTFGAPPVSLLPLRTPPDRPELRKSLFLSFVNEGDPVCRADKAYVRSLLDLFAAPAPSVPNPGQKSAVQAGALSALATLAEPGAAAAAGNKQARKSKSKASIASTTTSNSTTSSTKHKKKRKTSTGTTSAGAPPPIPKPVWPVPESVLSNAGRIVVLRSGADPKKSRAGAPGTPQGRKTVEERLDEGVVAQVATDEQLRSVIWGDPVCHVMRLYAGRIETLAVGAVTAQSSRG